MFDRFIRVYRAFLCFLGLHKPKLVKVFRYGTRWDTEMWCERCGESLDGKWHRWTL